MAGGLISFGDALKAFRRHVYQFPSVWRALVVCANGQQRHFAMEEAARIIAASSLSLETLSQAEARIETNRGGVVYFRTVDNTLSEGVRGLNLPQIITLCDVSPTLRAELKSRMRSDYIDEKYFRWDEATL